MTPCRCGKPTRNSATMCDTCTDLLGRALGDVPFLDEQLHISITRQKGATYDGSPSHGAEAPTPVNWAASDARTQLHVLLVAWVRTCSKDKVRSTDHRPGLPENTLTAMSRWLLWRTDGLALHADGYTAMAEITAAVEHAANIVDRAPERRFLGPCQCGRDLYAAVTTKEVTCDYCGWVFNTAELWDWMSSNVQGRLVSAREGATLLSRFEYETKQGTIDKWRERGRLTERGHNPAGHRLYLFDELLVLAQHAQDLIDRRAKEKSA